MRQLAAIGLVLGLVGGAGIGEAAKEQPLDELPRDVWSLAWVWTEPFKQVAKDTQRFDLVSGLWFGLLEGSVKSIERTADLLLPDRASDDPTPGTDPNKAQFRYSW